jgi:tetratricopeptide (TPR) repeat protein
MEESHEPGGLLRRAWKLYGEGKLSEAVQLLTAEGGGQSDPEIDYALGLAHKGLGNRDQARQAFQRTIDALRKQDRHVRATMLRRLAQGHVNMLDSGAWNLEAETWQHQ